MLVPVVGADFGQKTAAEIRLAYRPPPAHEILPERPPAPAGTATEAWRPETIAGPNNAAEAVRRDPAFYPAGHQPGWAARHGLSLFQYQMHNPAQPRYVKNSAIAKENAIYFRFVIDHYDDLPEFTVFAHGDVARHNPAWLQWLDCLRPDAHFASLSAEFVVGRRSNGGSTHAPAALARLFLPADSGGIGPRVSSSSSSPHDPVTLRMAQSVFNARKIIGAQGAKTVRKSFFCCELFVASRALLRAHPKARWQALHDLAVSGAVPARVFEYHFAGLIGGDPLDATKGWEPEFCEKARTACAERGKKCASAAKCKKRAIDPATILAQWRRRNFRADCDACRRVRAGHAVEWGVGGGDKGVRAHSEWLVTLCEELGVNARVKAAGVPGVTTCASVPIRDGKAWNHAAWWKAVCGEVHARGAFCPVASEKQPYDSIDALHAGDRC